MYGGYLHERLDMNRARHKAIHRRQANSQDQGRGFTSKTSPTPQEHRNGQSVENILNARKRQWFAIRATRNRAQSVYDSIIALANTNITPYLPTRVVREYDNDNLNNPRFKFTEKPLHTGLLFVLATLKEYKALLDTQPTIPGLTPYYDHFKTNELGRNDYLVIPDRQMESFKIIVESGEDDILTDQDKVPTYLNGDLVRVIDGPFKGVEGRVLNWKHQKRVFLKLDGIGCFGTAFVPERLIERISSDSPDLDKA